MRVILGLGVPRSAIALLSLPAEEGLVETELKGTEEEQEEGEEEVCVLSLSLSSL